MSVAVQIDPELPVEDQPIKDLPIYTYRDLALLPEPADGDRYELINGELIVSPAPSLTHQRIVNRLNVRLAAHVWNNGLGDVFVAPTGVKLSPHNLVEPDILFVSHGNAGIERQTLIEGAPDLVVEVLSPSSRGKDRITKRALYALVGVQEFWLVDPRKQTVTVLTLVDDDFVEVPPDAAGHAQSRLLPGFTLDPALLFAPTAPPLS